jgi:acyl carrier protein
MSTCGILNELSSIASSVFGRPIRLSESTTAQDIEEWDSLENIRFIVTIESRFGFTFTGTEVASLKCIGDIVTIINGKDIQTT